MNIETTFWEETARLMQEYRKEGNEQRVQGIVDCRILFNRLVEQLRKHNVSGSLGFEIGYKKGYADATKEACDEIAKNYQPNDR